MSSPPPEKAWPEQFYLARRKDDHQVFVVPDDGAWRLYSDSPSFDVFGPYAPEPQQQQGGVEEAVAEFERRAEGYAEETGIASAYRDAADYLRKHFDLPAPQQEVER